MISRRDFAKSASVAAIYSAGACVSIRAYAQEVNLPLGPQLFSVREMLSGGFDGTLQKIGSLGYREVEAAGFYQHEAQGVKDSMQMANLKCVSGHYSSDALHKDFQTILDFHKELGAEYIICSSPGSRAPATGGNGGALTPDDWRWNADEFNAFGAKASAVGLKLGYHNYVQEFGSTDGAIPYVELLKRPYPSHVTMELDCGWAIVAGASPKEYLHDCSSRITMLHVKDFKRPSSPTAPGEKYQSTELGRGFIDYQPIFAEAAKAKNIKHIFVEQEDFDVPAEESLKIDAD